MNETTKDFESATWPGYLLTDKEMLFAALLAQRKNHKKIATELNIPVSTVHSRVQWIYRKFGVENKGKQSLPLFIEAWNKGRPDNVPKGIVISNLTTREIEVSCLSAAGLAKWNIGNLLGMESGVVDSHRSHAYKKLGLSSLNDMIEKWPGLMEAQDVDWKNFVQGILREKNMPDLISEQQEHQPLAVMI